MICTKLAYGLAGGRSVKRRPSETRADVARPAWEASNRARGRGMRWTELPGTTDTISAVQVRLSSVM